MSFQNNKTQFQKYDNAIKDIGEDINFLKQQTYHPSISYGNLTKPLKLAVWLAYFAGIIAAVSFIQGLIYGVLYI